MEFIQENRVFLVRGHELLMFKHDDEYDGDSVNIEDYTKPQFLRYVAAKRNEDGIKQIFYYFTNISDQYITQSGKWIDIRHTIKYPAKPLTMAVLNNYIREGQYDNEIRFGVKNGENVEFTAITY